jgi:hypothetical protein
MPVFLCRWPNSDFSIVFARNKEHAIELLDEVGNADGCPIRQISDCLINFTLNDDGEVALCEEGVDRFGEGTDNAIMEFCYPALDAEYDRIFEEHRKEPEEARLIPELAQRVRSAVETERTRVPQPERKQPQTERGKAIAKQLDAPASVIDDRMRDAATTILNKFDPPDGSEH